MNNFIIDKNENNSYKSNLYDLYDIYTGSFLKNHKGPIFVDERDVVDPRKDLIHRQVDVDALLDAIRYCRSSKSFVIGLNGEWGSGKTTVINFVKNVLQQSSKGLKKGEFYEKKDFIIVDSHDFDPWIFENSELLTYGLLEVLFSKVINENKKDETRQIFRIAKFLGRSSLDWMECKSHIKIRNNLRKYKSNYNTLFDYINKFKNRISNKLLEDDKTLVFFIENIDRSSKDLVLQLFKLLGTLLDIQNVIYVISYEKARLDNFFSGNNDIQPKYYEKIINQEIELKLPSAASCSAVYQKVITNILVAYGFDENFTDDMQCFIDFFVNNVEDLRKFKRIINSVFYKVFHVNKSEYIKKDFALELVKFLNKDLYQLLLTNNNYLFVPGKDDTEITKEYFLAEPSYNDRKARKFSKELNDNFIEYKDILSSTFPYVDRIYGMKQGGRIG